MEPNARRRGRALGTLVLVAAASFTGRVAADTGAPPSDAALGPADETAGETPALRATPDTDAATSSEVPTSESDATSDHGLPEGLRIGGYVESVFGWNFGRPSNRITNVRGFDDRHATFTVSNVALDAELDRSNVLARLTLQVGHTPSTYYAAEPSVPGTSSVAPSSAELWKYVQQAHAGYRFARPHAVTVRAGIFLSPIGPESMAVRDDWNLSRSNLFFGLPFYHTGVRAEVAVSPTWSVSAHVYNGWNSVVDGNAGKSFMLQASCLRPDRLALSMLYFAGPERADGSPEGRRFRHDLDVYATFRAADRITLGAHANAGIEPNRFGTSGWIAGALYARAELLPGEFFVAARVDGFREWTASDASGRASPIFWPVSWVSSGTATLDYRPHPSVSFRLEMRHDRAAAPLYFGGTVAGDGSAASPYVPNRRAQTTLTLGLVAGF